MANIEQLENAFRKAHELGNTEHAKRFAYEIRKMRAEQPEDVSMYDRAGQMVEKYAPALPEIGASVTRTLTEGADFFGNALRVPANRMLEMTGSDYQIPTITKAASPVTKGEFMEPGFARDATRAVTETASMGGLAGAGMRYAGRLLPAMMPGESTAVGVGRSLTQTTPQLEAGLGALAGGGAETGEYIGGDTGELIGAVTAPFLAKPISSMSRFAANVATTGGRQANSEAMERTFNSMSGKSDEIASKMLAEAMVRQGIGPGEAMKIYRDMGPEAVPADIGDSFARLLRVAANKAPRIEGQQRQILNQRHETQINRIDKALNESAKLGGKSLDTELDAIEKQYTPQIDQLYGEARNQPLQLSPLMRAILETKNSAGNTAYKQAQRTLNNKRLAGDQITHISIIDATKQKLDDTISASIRKGKKNEARDLVRLKHRLIDEADRSIPKYKEARNLFAGKAALKSAAESGRLYLKMNADEIRDLTKKYSDGEKKIYRLGMRQALLDRVDDLKIGADAIRATFGKKGDLKKLRFLFDDNKDFKQFRDALKLESEFALTRRTAQANSTTAKQIDDENTFFDSIAETVDIISSGGALGLLNKAASMLKNNKKGTQAYMDGLEQVGDFLLIQGMQPERVRSLLIRGNADRILQIAKQLENKQPKFPPIWAASAIATTREDQE